MSSLQQKASASNALVPTGGFQLTISGAFATKSTTKTSRTIEVRCIIVSKAQDTMSLTFEATTPGPSQLAMATASEVVHALLDARDFLGYQLARAKGRLSNEEFREIAKKYMVTRRYTDPDELASKTLTLVRLIGARADSDTVSTVFNCEIDEAESALQLVVARLGASSTLLLFPNTEGGDARSSETE